MSLRWKEGHPEVTTTPTTIDRSDWRTGGVTNRSNQSTGVLRPQLIGFTDRLMDIEEPICHNEGDRNTATSNLLRSSDFDTVPSLRHGSEAVAALPPYPSILPQTPMSARTPQFCYNGDSLRGAMQNPEHWTEFTDLPAEVFDYGDLADVNDVEGASDGEGTPGEPAKGVTTG